jgi:hypothetical protein
MNVIPEKVYVIKKSRMMVYGYGTCVFGFVKNTDANYILNVIRSRPTNVQYYPHISESKFKVHIDNGELIKGPFIKTYANFDYDKEFLSKGISLRFISDIEKESGDSCINLYSMLQLNTDFKMEDSEFLENLFRK